MHLLVLALLVTAGDSTGYVTGDDSTPTGPPSAMRGRFSAGFDLGGNATAFSSTVTGSTSREHGYALGIGFYGRGGLQRDELFGAELEIVFASFWLVGLGHCAVLANFTFADWLTLSGGPSLGFGYLVYPGQAAPTLAYGFWTYGGAALRVDFHLGHRWEAGRRRAFTVSLEGEGGVTFQGQQLSRIGPSGTLYVLLGPSWY